MADNSLKIAARLDVTASVGAIINDIPKLEKTLRANKEGNVKIVAGLDTTRSTKLIQSQLNTIINQSNAPTIKVGVDVGQNNAIQSIVGGLKEVQNQAQVTASALSDNSQKLDIFKESLRNMKMDSTHINSIADDMRKLDVQISSINQSLNTTAKKKILSVEITGVDKLGQAVTLTRQYNTDTGDLIKNHKALATASQKSASQIENMVAQQTKRMADFKNQISQIHKSAIDPNASRSITNQTHTSELWQKYKEINDAIAKMGSTSKTVFAQQEADVSKLISEYKSLVSQYRNAENVSTTLKPDKLASAISKAESQFESLNVDIQNANVSSDKLQTNITTIQNILDKPKNGGIINKAEIEQAFTALHNAKSELTALIKVKTSNSSVEKVKLQAETLVNELNTFAKNNKGFDSFTHSVNNTTISVESLKTALGSITSTADLSVLKAQADALKSAFKSSTTDVTKDIKQIETAISSLNQLNNSTVFRNNSSNPQVTQTKQELVSLRTEYQQLLTQLQANPTSQGLETLRTKLTELDNRMKTAVNSAKAFQDQLRSDNSADQLRKKVELLTRQMKAYQATNSKAAKAYKQQFSDMFAILSNPNIDNQAFTTVQKQFQALRQEAIATGKVGKTMFQTIGDAVKKFAGWMSMTYLVSSFARSLRDMVNNVIELDTAMTNLKKVTDETEATYSKFLKNTSKQAKELHSTIIDLVEQVATWSKLGYSLSQAEHLAKVSMIYSKVGEVDNTTSVSDLVTVMKAFNIESEKSIHIVDSLNQLGNSFATDAKSLGEGLTKSSSALNAANNSFEQSIALLTGGTEITQNASEMGNALKTISMRIRGMKGELEELGEEYENVESISKIQTQILNLTGGHTNIFDDNGNFKSTYDILKSISEVYDDLTDPNRAELTEILFGKMRGNQGIALIQAFQSGQIEKAYESALNSAGSAQKEFDAWSRSIEAHINTFKASWESLSQTVMDSDFLKGIVDLGTTIISTLDSIIDKFGTIPTLLTSIATVGAFKNVGGTNKTRPFLYSHNFICIENETRFKIRLSNCWDDYAKAL